MTTEIRVVLDGPPDHLAGRFVEIEDDKGRSFSAGEWREREDGLWELVIKIPLDPSIVPHIHAAGTRRGWPIDTCAICCKDIRDDIHIRGTAP